MLDELTIARARHVEHRAVDSARTRCRDARRPAHFGHNDIDEQEIRLAGLEHRQRLGATQRLAELRARTLEHLNNEARDLRVVFDNEDVNPLEPGTR